MYFEDVRVPVSYRIGEEGKGFMYQMGQFQEERLFAGAAGRSRSRSGQGQIKVNRAYHPAVVLVV